MKYRDWVSAFLLLFIFYFYLFIYLFFILIYLFIYLFFFFWGGGGGGGGGVYWYMRERWWRGGLPVTRNSNCGGHEEFQLIRSWEPPLTYVWLDPCTCTCTSQQTPNRTRGCPHQPWVIPILGPSRQLACKVAHGDDRLSEKLDRHVKIFA